jgi:hypothetical protein
MCQLDLDHIKSQVGRDAGRMVTKAVDDLDKSLTLLGNGAISITDDAKKDIENFPRIIVGMGPQSTLQTNFAIARDNENKPLTSREAAINHASFPMGKKWRARFERRAGSPHALGRLQRRR